MSESSRSCVNFYKALHDRTSAVKNYVLLESM